MKHHISLKLTLIAVAVINVFFGVYFGVSWWNDKREHALIPLEYGYDIGPVPAELGSLWRFKARVDCFWSRPGENSFTGDKESALAALNLPYASRMKAMQAMRDKSGTRLGIAFRKPIVASNGTIFVNTFAMTFGMNIICYNTRMMSSKEQFGELYNIDGYWIFVPDICSNITRLLPWHEARRYSDSGRPIVVPQVPRMAQPFPHEDEKDIFPVPIVQSIPEPPMYAIFGIGGVMLFAFRRMTR